MKTEKKLNLDIAGSVSELEILMKKVLPRDIIYRLVMGRGLEFDGYRDYSSEDDSSNIDWKATARVRKTLVKQYIEERDLKFIFFVDVSDNMVFGSSEKLKCEYAAEMVAALSHLILISGDRVGFVLFNENVVRLSMPRLGTRQFDIIVHELSDPEVYGGDSDLNNILEGLIEGLDKTNSLIFLISDFVKMDESYKKNLEILSNLIETIAIIVRDPLDNNLPEMDKEIVIENENGEKLLINPKVARNSYSKNSEEQLSFVKEIFRDSNIDFLELSTDRKFTEGIAEFFQERIRTGKRVKMKNVY